MGYCGESETRCRMMSGNTSCDFVDSCGELQTRSCTDDDEIDIRDILSMLWGYRNLVLVVFIVFVLIGTVISYIIPPVYEVRAKIMLGGIITEQKNTIISPVVAKEVLVSRDFQKEAWLGESIKEGQNLKVTPIKDTNMLQITLETRKPKQGKVLVNKLINLFKREINLQEKDSQEVVHMLEKPFYSTTPVYPRKKQNIAVSGMLGLMIGVFAAFALDFLCPSPRQSRKK